MILTDDTKILANAFTLNMVNFDTLQKGINVNVVPITREDALNRMTMSAIGHQDLADMLNVDCNRINIELNVGDSILVCQRIGKRLNKGATKIDSNGDFILAFFEVTIQSL